MSGNRPTVVGIVRDSCRADFVMDDYQGVELTPNLRALSADSVTYASAVSAAPWTPPSHASMFAGQYPSSHEYLDDGIELDADHIAEILSDSGYDTTALSRRHRRFNPKADPNETRDLIDSPDRPDVVEILSTAIERELPELPSVRPDVPDDSVVYENLEALGYR